MTEKQFRQEYEILFPDLPRTITVIATSDSMATLVADFCQQRRADNVIASTNSDGAMCLFPARSVVLMTVAELAEPKGTTS